MVTAYTGNSAPSGTVTTEGSFNMVDLVNSAGSTVTGTSTSFEGCVEERDTVAQSTYTTIPSGAWDLDVNTIPSSDGTRWRPMWNELIYDRSSGGGYNNEQMCIRDKCLPWRADRSCGRLYPSVRC